MKHKLIQSVIFFTSMLALVMLISMGALSIEEGAKKGTIDVREVSIISLPKFKEVSKIINTQTQVQEPLYLGELKEAVVIASLPKKVTENPVKVTRKTKPLKTLPKEDVKEKTNKLANNVQKKQPEKQNSPQLSRLVTTKYKLVDVGYTLEINIDVKFKKDNALSEVESRVLAEFENSLRNKITKLVQQEVAEFVATSGIVSSTTAL